MVLKSTFDSLVQRCQLAARDPVSVPLCMQLPKTNRVTDGTAEKLWSLLYMK